MTRIFHLAGIVWLATAALVLNFGWNPLPGVFLGAVLLAVLVVGKRPQWMHVAAAAFLACMLTLTVFQFRMLAPSQPYAGTQQTMTGTVTDKVSYPSYTSLTIRASHTLPKGLRDTNIRAADFVGLDVGIGDVINYQIELEDDPLRQHKLYSENIRFSGRLLWAEKIAETNSILVRLARYRDSMSRGITRNLTGEEGKVLSGMLFGRTEQMPSDIRRDYARSGIAHLLSVSGLHLTVFVFLLSILLRFFGLSMRCRRVIMSFSVLIFMALTGFSYSVTRSGIMMLLWILAQMFGRDADARNSLGFALILILLQNPYAVFSISLQLSYLATLGIVTFTRPTADWLSRRFLKINLQELRKKSAWRSDLLSAACVSFCANLLTFPVVCQAFGFVSLVAPLTNLFVAPLVPHALGSGMLCGLTERFPNMRLAGRSFAFAGGVAIQKIDQIAKWWSSLPFTALPVAQYPLVLWVWVCTVVGVLLWRQRAAPAVKRYAASLAVITLLTGLASHSFMTRDAVLLAADTYGSSFAAAYGRQGLLIGAPHSRAAAENLADFFKDNGVTKISLLVTEREKELAENPTVWLAKALPVEQAVALDESYGFSAVLFGQVRISTEGEAAKAVTLDIGGLKIIKEFKQLALPAHILINQRNQLILDPRLRVAVEDHYYACRMFAVRLPGTPLPECTV